MEAQENKKCPWCHSEVNMVHFSDGVFIPLCPPNKCVKGVVVFIEVDTEEEAWVKWNQLKS